jgi:arabinose-5-phosphate isomerase
VACVPDLTTLKEALVAMTEFGIGLAAITGPHGELLGVVTDGDIRRAVVAGKDLNVARVGAIMTAKPVTISCRADTAEAQRRMRRLRLKTLVVLDDDKHVCGATELFDA